jgi:hypothetical protein
LKHHPAPGVVAAEEIMRAVVALVEARPETIIEDYQRVLELAGLADALGDHPLALVPQTRSGRWFPGAGSPPWQLDGVLSWWGTLTDPAHPRRDSGSRAVVLPASSDAGAALGTGWAWRDVLAYHGAEFASNHFRRARSFRAEPALPALERSLAGGLSLPAGLRDRSTLLLPVPAWEAQRPVAGSVTLLGSLLAADLPWAGGQVKAEAWAEVLKFARQALPGLGVVMDAVLWQVGPQAATRPPVARNLLLAGNDPVAVDAVATRLTGRDPAREPWFRWCHDQDLGAVRHRDIRLRGRADLLDLEFGIPDRQPSLLARGWERMPGAGFLQRKLKSGTLLKRHALTPWGGLYETYRAAGPTGVRG